MKKVIPNGHLKPITVPCNKCIICLSKKRAEWSFRIKQEYKVSKTAMFVTLTYDRENLKRANYQLQKRDLQLFMKRVRKNLQHIRIRYYAVGEYGTTSGRPHYHIILFNCDEATVRKSWTQGIIHIGQVNAKTIEYTLKYIVQPMQKTEGIQSPFALMSRGYGIGGHYLSDEMVAWHRSGNKNYTMIQGEKKSLPRFYKDKIWPRKKDRLPVSRNAKIMSLKNQRKELHHYINTYGAKWKEYKLEADLFFMDQLKKLANQKSKL